MALQLSLNPVDLDVSFDAAGEIDVAHDGTSLSNHSDSVSSEEDLDPRGGVFTQNLVFSLTGPTGWTLSASHEDDNGNPVDWVTGGSGIQHGFDSPTSGFLAVSVTATSGTQTKDKEIYIETKPKGGLPDRG